MLSRLRTMSFLVSPETDLLDKVSSERESRAITQDQIQQAASSLASGKKIIVLGCPTVYDARAT